jgi:formylglycine-generating enzyme required for sulfatase activity
MANTWQGEFPWQNLLKDGFEHTAPVGSFPPNGYGLFDMAGNVWEWTSDWFAARHSADAAKACCVPKNPHGGPIEGSYEPRQPNVRIPRKVVKGGSFLCSPSYCMRYRPAARQPQMIDSAMSHIGFRCIDRNRRAP